MRKIQSYILFFLFIFFVVTTIGYAQKEKMQALTKSNENYCKHPVWSPDGTKIAFTGSNYVGLWVMNSDGSDATKLSDQTAAGWGFEWSADSKSLLTRVAKYEGPRRYNAVKVFDISDGSSAQITDYKTFMPGLPHWADFDQKIILFSKKDVETFDSGKTIENFPENINRNYTCFLKRDKLAIMNNYSMSVTIIDPNEASGYLNPVISPDNTKIAYEVYGGNLFVANIDGSNPVDLGVGFYPQWSPDSKKIVYTYSQDNGHQFTLSDIYIVNLETKTKENITNTTELLEMHPSWSPDGTKIVFDEFNTGILYVTEVE